ncbi:phosphoenolpyruvate--protein phosphotransferase [Algimonas ampicilliniresistens]|uniref:phosphoenolpyruvate--protein phosphotransferase n=1 Tax=Algimonas ampicilliniresistens TaxID=1298735 RepID=A0ABQ5VCQ3_9PROT|nr:phosphoenolpyruvate--protein phosphotransferase [Algimonas ampicilliniresistens]GLQ24563.1 phosphoenolpyruvate--protein phosphotransferase [Algimonas ampicilliniresistens]
MSLTPDIVTTPPKLMRAIRAAMAGTESVQVRLDDFVSAISSSMRVNVASIYLLRKGDELELSATKGLKRSAVHKTRMKPGEGLVGHVALTARPLNLADAPSHPLFSYRPETGEDPYKSFLGVPILRGGRTLGVLVVQSKEDRIFSEDEVEDLLTVAMVLAEIIVDDERIGGKKAALKGIQLTQIKPESLTGKAFSPGLARGHAVLHRPPVAPANLLAENIAQEEIRLEDAIAELRRHVDAMVSGEIAALTRASKEIYEAYRTFAYDRKWVGRLREAVHSGLTAEAAVERVRNEHRARLMKVRDPYLRARLHDLEDLANRMLRLLAGESTTPEIPDDAILFARELGPAELLDYDRKKLAGLVLEEGSASSHTAIIARALGLPLIGRVSGVLDRIETGDDVLVDAEDGNIHLRPLESQVSGFQLRLNIRGEMSRAYDQLRFKKAVTRDGIEVDLMLNAGLLVDLPQLDLAGADGIGLFRTEFQFMVSDFMPRLEQQTDLYRKAILAAGDRPVTFRTLDLGGDKILPYIDPVPEENPAIGWRAIRIGLDRPGLMRYQLRALVAAGAGRHLRVMFPMVTTVEEMVASRALFDREIERAKTLGRELPAKVEVGVMLETPSLAWQVISVCDHADFVSVGANDLMQFFFAADRDNARVSDRYDPLSPPALSILSFIAENCRQNNTPVSVCGEIAGRPLEAACLVALGFHTLSMSATGIGPVKSTLMALNAAELRELILPNIKVTSRLSSLRETVRNYCIDNGVPV